MVFSRILKLYSYISSRRTAKLQKQYDYEHLVPFLISGRGLSCDEKNAVAAKWGNIINVPVKWGFPYYQALKEIDTFNADYYHLLFIILLSKAYLIRLRGDLRYHIRACFIMYIIAALRFLIL